MGCVDSGLAEADWETMNDDMQTKLDEIEAEAEKLAAGIYGIPEWVKCFTVDLHLGAIQRYEKKVHLNLEYKAGFIAGANHVLEELKTERAETAAREAGLTGSFKFFADRNNWKFYGHDEMQAELEKLLNAYVGGREVKP